MQPCGLRDLAHPWGRLSFGLKAGRVAGYARGTLATRELKNIHATLRAAGFGVPLGATFVWPQGRASCRLRPWHLGQKGAKNNHVTLWAAGFGVPSGATFVWPQDQTSCGLSPQRLSRKRHAPEPIDELGARQATFVGVTIISLVAEDDMINQLDAEERSGAGDAIGQGVVLPTGAGIA